MRVLVTGAAGVVGTELCRDLRARNHEVIPVDVAGGAEMIRADLRDAGAAREVLEKHRPEVVLHLAANKNVVQCEENREAAHAVNFGITENLAQGCAAISCRMVYFSSDYVFGKEDRFWVEGDVPCPTTQYGRDKVESERVIAEQVPDHAIIRTAGLYGFPGDLTQVVRGVLSRGDIFDAFENLTNCPTWTGDLFRMIAVILEQGERGIFHCVGPESLSRFAYARCVAAVSGMDASLVRATSLDFTKDVRPPTLRLDGRATYRKLGVMPGTLEENLRKALGVGE